MTRPAAGSRALELIVVRRRGARSKKSVDARSAAQHDAPADEEITPDVIRSIERVDFDGWVNTWLRTLAKRLRVDPPRAV
jgi:hypothetical protein